MSGQEHNTPETENQDNAKAVENAAEVPKNTEQAAARPSEKTAETVKAEAAKPEAQAAQPAVAPVVVKQSGGKGLATGALVLALLGLGASGFLFVQGQNVLKTQELAFNQKIDKAALGESQNASLLQDNLRKQTELNAAIEQLGAAQKANAEQIAQANRAYQDLLKGRANWLVDEVEATLNLASQQLLLSGNVPVAVSVLGNIENRLNRFEQADLLPIKQAVSSDLAALKSQPYLDVAAASLRLDRLESAVAGLPLTMDTTLQPKSSAVPHQSNANLPWWENAWNKAVSSLQGMVEVRKLNNGDAMLLAPDQIYFVRENLRLRLLDARAALMQHNGEVYQSDLDSAETTVKQYFDTNSPATQSWLKELADLKTLDVRMVSGDALKASLLAVRNYQDAVRLNQNIQAEAAAASANEQAASAPAVAASEAATPSENAASAADAAASAPAPAEQNASEAKAKGEQA
ncbi:MAG: uroporphyrinogen-III C-methyltransferase [Neisseria sp.]|nr:uroporphyrinogen-III C-methyltransferase [Neisseria sp.]